VESETAAVLVANIGPADLTVIFVVALLIFGPNKLPEVGRQVGKAIRDVRKLSNEFLGSFAGVRDEVTASTRSLNPFAESHSDLSASQQASSEPVSNASTSQPRRRGLSISTLPNDVTAPEEETK
jgi:sec-independent protein translocase protein TatA